MFNMGSLIRMLPGFGQSNPFFMSFEGDADAAIAERDTKITNLEGEVNGLKEAAKKVTWKGGLSDEIKNSPTLQTIEDNPEGLQKTLTNYLNLEKLLGHEKVPIPKDDNDEAAWSVFRKAMGIPDKAEAYGLADADIPPELKGMAFDKGKFAEVVHAHKLTDSQAKGLWGAYTDMVKATYQQSLKDHKTAMDGLANTLRSEMGDTYDTQMGLVEKVIKSFSSEKETEDFVLTALSKDPRGIKFLAKIGSQFAENKVGDFKYDKFSLAPEDAKNEIAKIMGDPKHPYNDPKATPQDHSRAVDYVNSLQAIINKGNG